MGKRYMNRKSTEKEMQMAHNNLKGVSNFHIEIQIIF